MLSKITTLLEKEQQLKARQIAKALGLNKTKVNSLLHKRAKIFSKDENHYWSLTNPKELIIELDSGWVDSDSFEKTLSTFFKPDHSDFVFIAPKKCYILLDAVARLLAICNQLALKGKLVTINFKDTNTLGYLNRVGFVDLLDKKIKVLPNKPKISNAKSYKGTNNRVVEFGEIDPSKPNDDLPKQLKDSFVIHAGEKYTQFAFTSLSELFENVIDHSDTPIPGFAALQLYKGQNKNIQTVISDSGKGIIGTLGPVLVKEYPEIAKTIDMLTIKGKVELVKKVLNKGGISKFGKKEGRGLGLHQSQKKAAQYNTTITIRQEDFEVKLHYKDGKLFRTISNLDLISLDGTHISFKIYLD